MLYLLIFVIFIFILLLLSGFSCTILKKILRKYKKYEKFNKQKNKQTNKQTKTHPRKIKLKKWKSFKRIKAKFFNCQDL